MNIFGSIALIIISGIEIGRSLKSWSDTKAEAYVGNSATAVFGTKFSAFGGVKADATAAFSAGLTLGMTTNVYVGGKHSYTLGYSQEKSKGPSIKHSGGDNLTATNKDYIIAAGDQFMLVANALQGKVGKTPKDAAQTFPMIYGSDTGLELTIGNQIEKIKPKDPEPSLDNFYRPASMHWKMITGVQAGMVATGLTLMFGLEKHDDEEMGAAITLEAFAGLFAVLTLIGGIYLAAREWKDSKIEPVRHKEPDAKIELKEDGEISIRSDKDKGKVNISADGKKGRTDFGTKGDDGRASLMANGKKGCVWVKANGEGGKVTVAARDSVEIKGFGPSGEVAIKGGEVVIDGKTALSIHVGGLGFKITQAKIESKNFMIMP